MGGENVAIVTATAALHLGVEHGCLCRRRNIGQGREIEGDQLARQEITGNAQQTMRGTVGQQDFTFRIQGENGSRAVGHKKSELLFGSAAGFGFLFHFVQVQVGGAAAAGQFIAVETGSATGREAQAGGETCREKPPCPAYARTRGAHACRPA